MWGTYTAANPSTTKGQSLNVVSGGGSDTDSVSKFRLELSSGKNIPDITELNYDEVPEFVNSGALADISAAVTPDLGNVTTAAKTLTSYDGQTVAVPIQVNEKLWFYRADLFAKAGIDPAQVKTQADFVAAGKKLQAVEPGSYIWNLPASPAPYQWGMVVSGNGASYSTKSPCAITVGSDPGTAQAFQAMKDLRNSGAVSTSIGDFTPQWQSALANGTLASTLSASWLPTFIEQYAPALKGKWAVAQWPEIGGAVGGSEAGGAVFVIPAASPHKAQALAFLTKTLMTASGASAYLQKNTAYIPNVTSLLQSPSVQDNSYFGPSLIKAYLAASSTYKVFPYDASNSAETTALGDQLANYLNSPATSPSSFLQTAQSQLASQVGCPYSQ
ncbi:extracellular solute-binding protein [Actinospica durhamensis]|uniref:Extracellular solute-binding protein n=1 Tax=Actinospica durhamensis TaxID=1508375 RepID=A0A941EVK8_9ACTN|nr:extracellular solute-binding protein [Actinospica durhamensis]MBR7837243.1 extracellular solute-binding protein [Actinospica durhamensis]